MAEQSRLGRFGSLNVFKDVIHDVQERRCCVDRDAARWDLFPRFVQVFDQPAFRRPSSPFVRWSPVKASMQCFRVNLQDEDAIEQIDELGKVSRPAAEERHRFPLVCRQRPDFGHSPDVVPVHSDAGDPRYWFAGCRITLIGEFTVAVDGVKAAPPQFIAHCGLARARAAFDEVILPAHA